MIPMPRMLPLMDKMRVMVSGEICSVLDSLLLTARVVVAGLLFGVFVLVAGAVLLMVNGSVLSSVESCGAMLRVLIVVTLPLLSLLLIIAGKMVVK